MDDGVLVPFIIFGTIGWVFTTVMTNLRKARAAKSVADLHARVLDKCAASQDLIAYIESPAGRKFLESASTEGANPPGRILSALQSGFILTLIGIAEFLVRGVGFDRDADRTIVFTGAIAVAIGIGFLLSAASSFVLCKSWGLLVPSHLRQS